MSTQKFQTVDEYFETLPMEVVNRMTEIRSEIKKVSPGASECISYNIPALKYKEVLVSYAFFKNHIGFYPTPSAMIRFENEIMEFRRAKGSVQFPHNKPLPVGLIKRMTKFRYEAAFQK